jgi:hypothetical protein
MRIEKRHIAWLAGGVLGLWLLWGLGGVKVFAWWWAPKPVPEATVTQARSALVLAEQATERASEAVAAASVMKSSSSVETAKSAAIAAKEAMEAASSVAAAADALSKDRARDPYTMSELGQTGDLFGGINALFAAGAFAGVLLAAYLQWQTYIQQSEISKLVRDQHIQQSFEPLFFALLQRQISLAGIRVYRANGFPQEDLTVGEVIRELRLSISAGHQEDPADNIAWAKAHYDQFYKLNGNIVGPYIRWLHQIFKLIDKSSLSPGQKIDYASSARALLSSNEVFLLAINGLKFSDTAFGKLIEKYGILKHIGSDNGEDEVMQDFARYAYGPTATMSSEERNDYWEKNPQNKPNN